MWRSFRTLLLLALAAVLTASGCSLVLPEIAQLPVIRNPFPQLKKVAVAPFFNQSDEPTLDGREVAMAYFAELQATPGFEVVPVGVVEEAIIANRVDLSGPGEARRLAQILGVDALVVGSVTDFSEYYPPRIGLRVEWYAANPGFHEIPAGYGLPWDSPEEEYIPDSLVYESQMALARQQMAAVTPDCDGLCDPLPAPPPVAAEDPFADGAAADPNRNVEMPAADPEGAPASPSPGALFEDKPGEEEPTKPGKDQSAARKSTPRGKSEVRLVSAEEELPTVPRKEAVAAISASAAAAAPLAAPAAVGAIVAGGASAKVIQPYACEPCEAMPVVRPECNPYDGPILSHTRIYNGTDADVVEALEGYVAFRHEERFGGWKSYLRRSDDFIRFCCHMNIAEMLSARGGSRKTQVVWRWSERR